MTSRIARAHVVFLLIALALAAPGLSRLVGAAPAGPPPAAEATMKKMIEAVKTKAFESFMADTDDDMRAALSRQMFEGVSNQLAPRLKQGYRTSYLTKLRQEGADVFLWKLEISDNKNDHLIKLSHKDGKVAGFLIN